MFKCPTCNGNGVAVQTVTVDHFIKTGTVTINPEDSFFACLNPACDVVYINVNNQAVFHSYELKEPVWYKSKAEPKIICYCNKVTDKDIINAVLNKGAISINEVIEITGAMKNSNCSVNNPLSKCCLPAIRIVVESALNNFRK